MRSYAFKSKTISRADGLKKVIFYTLVPFFILVSAVTFIGFIVLAYFYNCNPLETKEITQTDHITILFAKNVLKDTPGLFGLYVSCIMSATLSTLSSGMNSMSAAIYEDFLKHRLDGKITDSQATKLNKLLVVLCGLTATALAFAAEPLGGILKVCIPVMGAMSGPMVAIFVLAMFFPSSGVVSCIVSYVISNIIMFIICVASFKQDPYKDLFLPTNTTIGGCGGNSNYTVLSMPPYDAHYGNPDTWYISRISTFGYSGLGFVIMMFVGICINMFYKEQNPENIAHLTYKGRKLDFPDAERIRKCISIPSNIVRDIAIPKRVIVKTK